MKPFLKWAGGKRWLMSNHRELIPEFSGRFIEPFVGSGAVFFTVLPSKGILGDYNQELINTYLALKNNPTLVRKHLKAHAEKHSDSYYYQVRSNAPRGIYSQAARMIYLNRTCFNGLYRVNLRGEFNVPKGTKNTVLLPDDDFSAISSALKGVTFINDDFEVTLSHYKEGDVIYVDPPYTVKHNNNAFVKYNERIFSWEDQERLANMLTQLAESGAKIVISNADHAAVRNLYGNTCWIKDSLSRATVLASDSARRGKTTELLVRSIACIA
ncbi:MAG: Dam family site-specific DNA-(adenine-N6)-methyltransferase [Verrucomicrobiota bacterium]